MSVDGTPDVIFYVFDLWNLPNLTYTERQTELQNILLQDSTVSNVVYTMTHKCDTVEDIHFYLEHEKNLGGEGLICRNPNGKYKYGRSTPKEQLSVKLKFFETGEFEVIGFEERMHNGNEATTNELGYTERSSCKENLIPMNTLGSLVLKYGDSHFKVGTGFSDEQRQEIWNNKESYIGKLASVRYMSVGMDKLPRIPSWLGWRDEDDL